MSPATILPAFLAIPTSSNRSLSSCKNFNNNFSNLFCPFTKSPSSVVTAVCFPIRMGGGPRTFPGGVSKWQWKRMQAKKSNQLLKARLCRERQLYEMRKRAELKAAISELERPWEAVERAPVLFSASADEQIKALADRFQRPNGFDMWSERDGPRLFRSADEIPSARFFPKGAVHSVRPYGGVEGERYDDWIARGAGGMGRGRRSRVLMVEGERTVGVEGENGEIDCGVDGSRIGGDDVVGGGDGNSGSCGLELELADGGSKMDGSFDQGGGRGSKEGSYQSYSELEKEENKGRFGRLDGGGGNRNAMDGGFDRRGGRSGRRGSYRLEQGEEGNEGSFGEHDGRRGGSFDRRGGRGRGRGSYQLESEKEESDGSTSEYDGRRGNWNAMASGFDRRRGRSGNWNAMAGGFDRRGGRGGRRGSYRLKLGKEENEGSFGKYDDHGGNWNAVAGNFDRSRGRRGGRRGFYRFEQEEEENEGSFGEHDDRGGLEQEKEENEGSYGEHDDRGGNRNAMADGFERRGGRGRRRGSYPLDRRGIRNALAGSFDRRGGRGGRRVSYQLELEKEENEGSFGKRDVRGGNRNAMTDSFNRRGGRGGRQSSYRLEPEKEENEGSFDKHDGRRGNWNAMASSFNRFRGRGGRRGSYRSYIEREKEENENDSFGKRIGRGGSRNVMDGSFDWRGGRSGNRGSFRSNSVGGRGRDFSDGGRVSLRPTTELRLVGGDSRESREVWRKDKNDGFRVSRGRKSP